MNELDRFIHSSTYDPLAGRRQPPAPLPLSPKQKREALRVRITEFNRLLFNDDGPYERLAAISGETAAYWSRFHRQPTRTALRTYLSTLRAHITGLRDHLSEMEREILQMAVLLEDREGFALTGPKKRRR